MYALSVVKIIEIPLLHCYNTERLRKLELKDIPSVLQHYHNKNDHRSGGAVKEGCPYICIKHIIKLKTPQKMW